jgi:uncharacterized protein (DUF1501 family)
MDASRRAFLHTSASLKAASVSQGLGAGAAFAVSLAAMGSAAAQTVGAGDPYKALVCLFMYGGNDSHNWVLPVDAASHAQYSAARGGVYDAISNATGLALSNTGLTPMAAASVTGGLQFSMAPELAGLRALYDGGKAAVMANIGPLIQPTTKLQYQSGVTPLPPKLFSHNDQQSLWQASSPEGARYGWAGRMGDLMMGNNSTPVFTSISATGNTVMLAGQNVVQYQVGVDGSVSMPGISGKPGVPVTTFNSTTGAAHLIAAMKDTGTTALQAEYARILTRSMDTDSTFKSKVLDLTDISSSNKTPILDFDARLALPTTVYGNPIAGQPTSVDKDSLAKQLRMVAQIISKNTAIGAKRQVFMVSIGGFDTHDNQPREQSILMQRVSNCIQYFHAAISALGMANQVALFTASDFGRTLVSNGKGSDHGWGSTHFIVGGDGVAATGAVKGGNIYGSMPPAGLGHSQDLGSGRLLPTTGVDQYASTLGKWYGISDTNLAMILPNLANYNVSGRNLGFMA